MKGHPRQICTEHVQRKDARYIGNRMLRMGLPGRIKEGIPKGKVDGCGKGELVGS